ncbi:MAG: PKD domain-containing protein [Bacteroidales bacterium]
MRKLPLMLFTFLFPVVLSAQIEFTGQPWSQELKLKSSPQRVEFSGLTPQAMAAYQSSLSPGLKSMIFAYPFDTVLNTVHNGTWEILENGSRIWRLALYSPNALSLNLIFSRFKLPSGAKMYLYSPDYQTVRGAFTSDNQTVSGVLATVPIPSDEMIVELNVPAQAEFSPIVEISKVSHDFKGFFESFGSAGSGDCNVDINCPAGDNWQIEKKSVVKFIRGGVWLCSGALINNARNDGRPLLLSANHTIGNQTHATETVFFFRYERPACGSGNGTLQYTLSGSKLLATTSKVDFSLVELSSAPPPDYEPVYAGWDRRVYTFLDTVTCIHHPNGSVKKISKSYHRVVTADFGGGYDTNTHWKISAWDLGTTEPGSSGSPLFNNEHRIVGDLTGGDASCSYNFNDYFEKFSVSWDKYPDSSNQLKYWLDPGQTGVQVANSLDPYSGGKPVANFNIRPDKIQVGRKVYFTDLSTGEPTSWRWSFEGGIPSGSDKPEPQPVKFPIAGSYPVTLLISNELGEDSLQQTVTVSDFAQYSLSENRIVPERVVELQDRSTAVPNTMTWMVTGASSPLASGSPVQLSFVNPNDYTVKEIIEFQYFTDTLIHYNQIRVIPEVLAYRSFTFRNVKSDEHTSYLTMGTQGYLPGSNSMNIVAFAEAFRNTSDTAYVIHGITLPIDVKSKWPKNYYLPLVIWNAGRKVVLRDSIMISDFQEESRLTKWLRSPVNFDTLIYVGFEIRSWDQGTFVSSMATDRGQSGHNTAFAIKGLQWQSMTDVAGIRTSLDLSVEASALMKSYKDEIRVLPNYSDGSFTFNLGTLVFSKVDITIYNMAGQQVTPVVSKTDNQISFSISPPVPGVYVVRLMVDNYQFSTKVMILR